MPDTGTRRTIGLALQGGGAHAAFTWGVLDRLLDEVANGGLFIKAISGTSGGALNGAACAYGLRDNAAEAKRLIERLWNAVGARSSWYPFIFNSPTAELDLPRRWNVDANLFVIGQGMLEQIGSPYLTPWLQDPIGSIMEQVIPDFGRLNEHKDDAPDLYVAATNVNRMALRIFGPGEITSRALMASTCYPTLFQAVEIDGEFYWDGGYMANPALNPLVDSVNDLLTVLIDPLRVEHGPPKLPQQIVNRINEVSFGSSWVTEVRQIELINQFIRDGVIPLEAPNGKTYAEKRFHVIRADDFMEEIGAASKSTPSPGFFLALREAGWKAGNAWVQDHLGDVGVKSSFDVDTEVKRRLTGSADTIRSLQPANGKS
ncbi:patatin-like phospholipase family protein [Paraburkholderia sediminicola]|uniref:patatin-like phospholipase family protein n=1 Tax=Paraburkholderia sediminicola TaxID=458836 RepID=UPI0038B702E3